jgi:hypothetical protein
MEVPPKVFPVLAEQRSDKADRVVVETVRRYANAQGWQRCQADDAINQIGRVVVESLGGHV